MQQLLPTILIDFGHGTIEQIFLHEQVQCSHSQAADIGGHVNGVGASITVFVITFLENLMQKRASMFWTFMDVIAILADDTF